jgi:hypothetical protein
MFSAKMPAPGCSTSTERITIMKRIFNVLTITFLASAICRAATINVTPANVGIVATSPAGSTFSFAPGTYTLTTNPNGSAVTWPQGTYIGGGATFALSGGADTTGNETLIRFASGSDVSGFTFTDAAIICQGGAFNIHGNTFNNMPSNAIFVVGDSNSQYVNNTFTNGGNGIYGYPGSNNTYSNNKFDNVSEPIHLASATSANITVSNNTITRAQRYAIEIQLAATNLTVSGNSITQWLANGNQGTGTIRTGISIASSGTGISVTNNQIIQDHFPGSPVYGPCGAGLEIMGDNNITVTGNTFYNWNGPYLNGVRAGATFTIANNTIYGPNNNGSDPMGYALAPIVQTTDKILPLAAYPGPTPAPIPAGITVTANGQAGQVSVTCPAGSTLGIYASTLNPNTAVNLGTISGTSTTIGGVPLYWKVTVTVTTGGTTYTLPPVQVTNSTISISGPFNPALVQTAVPAPTTAPSSALPAQLPADALPASTPPAVTHTISVSIDGTPVLQKQVLSDGSVK